MGRTVIEPVYPAGSERAADGLDDRGGVREVAVRSAVPIVMSAYSDLLAASPDPLVFACAGAVDHGFGVDAECLVGCGDRADSVPR